MSSILVSKHHVTMVKGSEPGINQYVPATEHGPAKVVFHPGACLTRESGLTVPGFHGPRPVPLKEGYARIILG